MESTTSWVAQLAETWGAQLRAGFEYLPGILGAIVVLVIGWVLARLFRRATHSISRASNRLLNRAFPSGMLAGVRMSPFMTSLVGEVVFWSVAFLTLTAAARIAGLSTISEWLDRIAVYLPNLFAAFAIVVVGYLVGIFAREQLTPQPVPSSGAGRKELVGRVAQVAAITIAVVMSLDQLGIDVILPVVLLAIAAAAIAITFGVSIALGARSYMGNLVGMRSVQGQISAGLNIRVNGITGHVIEMTPSQVVLETEEGRALIPGQQISESVTIILAPVTDGAPDNE